MPRDLPVVDAEVPFHVGELFFSRTDPRGIIRSGNGVFQRVSGFGWGDLLGRPHKVVRHPHMPRAVFHLLWEAIGAGRPIGAFVKNRAENGRHYWVFAVVSAVADGFLSVRLKPTTDLLRVVEAEYAALRRREVEERATPAESAAALLERMPALGFEDYPAFMAAALAQEAAARDEALGRPPDRRLAELRRLADAVRDIRAEVGAMAGAIRAMSTIPVNIQIEAARLGAVGRPISVIGSNYGVITRQLQAGLAGFAEALDGAFARVNDALFLAGAASLHAEAATAFAAEGGLPGAIDRAEEMARLEATCADWVERAAQGSRDVLHRAAAVRDACVPLRPTGSRLDVTRVLCRIELAHLDARSGGLGGAVAKLDAIQSRITESLRGIDERTQAIHHGSSRPAGPAAIGLA